MAVEIAKKKETAVGRRISEENIEQFYESPPCVEARKLLSEKPETATVKVCIFFGLNSLSGGLFLVCMFFFFINSILSDFQWKGKKMTGV